jgi:hypothetical protein
MTGVYTGSYLTDWLGPCPLVLGFSLTCWSILGFCLDWSHIRQSLAPVWLVTYSAIFGSCLTHHISCSPWLMSDSSHILQSLAPVWLITFPAVLGSCLTAHISCSPSLLSDCSHILQSLAHVWLITYPAVLRSCLSNKMSYSILACSWKKHNPVLPSSRLNIVLTINSIGRTNDTLPAPYRIAVTVVYILSVFP